MQCEFKGVISALPTPYDQSQQIDGNDSNLLIVFYVQIMPDDLVMQLHRF
ncbi:aldehyde dehydrogenase [Escherichia coli]|nr:aldehyde dehydrogenase [Escherichia coli]